MVKDIEITGAGLSSDNKILFNPGKWQCEKIADGISLNVGDGSFLISFGDLTKMYKAAESVRRLPDALLT